MWRFRILHNILFLVVLFQAHAQVRNELHGTVLDAVSEAPLAGVHVHLLGSEVGAVTGEKGDFMLTVDRGSHIDIKLTSVGFATLRRSLTAEELAHDRPIVLHLQRQAVELPAVTIERSAPEVVYQRSDLHVGDYFTNADGLWVLTYDKPQLWHTEAEAGRQVYRDARLHLLDTNFVECCSVRLPTEVVRLHHDHAQRTIVEGTKNAWIAALRKGEVVLHETDLTTLEKSILPWTDSIQGQLIGNNFTATFPAFDHFAYDVESEETRAICAVQDAFLMELFRSQYKYMSGHDKVVAMDLAIETGIDAEIIAGYMTQFYKDQYFDPPYAPLFVVHDTLCVFDHYTERIRRFLPDLSPAGDVPITHQRERTWKTRLLQDAGDGTVYALFARNLHTWLRTVDATTGALGPVRMLDHPFPEDVQVHGGHAYFIYRPYGSLQHRTLYRQALR